VLPQDIGNYKLIYVPYPVMLRSQTVAALEHYVRGGGALVCEGLPAYFGDHGHVGEKQPNYGLDALFGCRQTAVEFDPDLSEDLQFELYGHQIFGRYFRQEYETAGGMAVGHFAGGAVAAMENRAGAGKTLLIGTFPGAGYYRHKGEAAKAQFAQLLEWAGITQRVKVSNPAVQSRLHRGQKTILWATNATSQDQMVTMTLDAAFTGASDLWAGRTVTVEGRTLSVTVPAKDAAVLNLF
jgi:beta-galactosidase